MKKRCIKGITFSLLVTSTMLSGCSTTNDYELRQVENENKTTINTSDIKTTSVINFVEDIASDDRILVGDENVIVYDFAPLVNYKEDLDDSIVVEEDVIQAEIEKDKAPQEEVAETPQEELTETPQEEVAEIPQEEVTEIPQEEVTEELQEEVTVTPQEEVTEEPQEEVTETPQEEVTETPQEEVVSNDECVYSTAEHTISQTLINYVGAGNYAKWVANDTPSCPEGLTIYDYMDYFNMTKSFFVNLTAYDSTYKDVNVYAH